MLNIQNYFLVYFFRMTTPIMSHWCSNPT